MNSKQITTITIKDDTYPVRLLDLSRPPKQLYASGAPIQDWISLPKVGIVGSRKVTSYGRMVTEKFARELAEQGIVVISGLALGVDSIAHQAALYAGGRTVAVLPGPVETIMPRSHEQLGQQIARKGGTLLSEYPIGTPALKHNFVERNRIVAALSDILLITEAAEKSGSLHTAHFAQDLGRKVAVVPGTITSPMSVGSNNLLKQGAHAVTNSADILLLLGITTTRTMRRVIGGNEQEQVILDLLAGGVTEVDELQIKSKLTITLFNQSLTMLEITGKIAASGPTSWSLK